MNTRFTEDEYLQEMIERTMRVDDHSWYVGKFGDNYYGRYFRHTDVLIPLGVRRYVGESREMSYYVPMEFHWAYKNAEFFRWSLVDESIPLHDRDGNLALNGRNVVFGLYDGCRQSNAIAIAELKYWPALPELREAMLHEYDSYMRTLCVEAIGVMGKRGLKYAKDIRESIRKFNDDPLYIGYAVGALKKLGDKEAVPLIREVYEMTRERIDQLSFDEAMKSERGFIYLIEDLTEALIRLDPVMARDVLAMELVDPNPHVRHFTHSAFKLSPLRHDAKLINSSYASMVASLPDDPKWIFRRQKPISASSPEVELDID